MDSVTRFSITFPCQNALLYLMRNMLGETVLICKDILSWSNSLCSNVQIVAIWYESILKNFILPHCWINWCQWDAVMSLQTSRTRNQFSRFGSFLDVITPEHSAECAVHFWHWTIFLTLVVETSALSALIFTNHHNLVVQ